MRATAGEGRRGAQPLRGPPREGDRRVPPRRRQRHQASVRGPRLNRAARTPPSPDAGAHPARRRRLRGRARPRVTRCRRSRCTATSSSSRARASSSACTAAPGRSAMGRPPLRRRLIATAWSQRVEQAARGQGGDRRARRDGSSLPGSTIFLDASSTALRLARRLMEDPPNELTLVTSSPAIAYEMQAEPVHVVVGPRRARPAHADARRALDGRVPVAAQLRRRVRLRRRDHARRRGSRPRAGRSPTWSTRARSDAKRTVALIDASKFGRASLLTIMRADDPDLIITDSDLPVEVANAYRAAGVHLETLPTKEAA